jgi:prepilin-type processing-associated H-X9-DG protein
MEYPNLDPGNIDNGGPGNGCNSMGGNRGFFAAHSGTGLLNWGFADGHVKAMKLLGTITPTWRWDDNTQNPAWIADIVKCVNTVETEYK